VYFLSQQHEQANQYRQLLLISTRLHFSWQAPEKHPASLLKAILLIISGAFSWKYQP
jgi:hypothetical protein